MLLVLSVCLFSSRASTQDEIEKIRLELENVENPKEIPYPVWLCNHNQESKQNETTENL